MDEQSLIWGWLQRLNGQLLNAKVYKMIWDTRYMRERFDIRELIDTSDKFFFSTNENFDIRIFW